MSWAFLCTLTVVAAFCTGLSLIVSPKGWHKTAPGGFVLLSVPVQMVASYLHIDGASTAASEPIWPLWLGILILVSAVVARPLTNKHTIKEIGDD